MPLPIATHRVTLPTGLSTRVLDTGGAGVPAVLIHGIVTPIEIWERVIPLLAAERRVIAFDLPGIGEGDKPDAAYDAPFFTAQIKGVLDALSIERAHLIGSSLGASLIVRFSAQHHARIERVILAAPSGFGTHVHPLVRLPALPIVGYALGTPMRASTAFSIKLAMFDPRNATRALIDIADRCSKLPGAHRAFVRTMKRGTSVPGVRDPGGFESDARALRKPVLIMWGKQDRIFSWRHSAHAQQLIEGARVELFDACGHYPHWEHPARFAEVANRHLS